MANKTRCSGSKVRGAKGGSGHVPILMRPQVRQAVTWKIASELLRRHHTRTDLKIFETHPGGGSYDCLSFFVKWGHTLFDLHQGSGRFHLFDEYGKPRADLERLNWPDGDNYVLKYLGSFDTKAVVDELEDVVGLPSYGKRKLPPTTPPVLMFRLISGIVGHHMFSRKHLRASCGWYDSSGMEGSYIRKELLSVPQLAGAFPEPSWDWHVEAKAASRFWLLEVPDSDFQPIILDLRGVVYFPDTNYEPWNVWNWYSNRDRNFVATLNELHMRSLVAWGDSLK